MLVHILTERKKTKSQIKKNLLPEWKCHIKTEMLTLMSLSLKTLLPAYLEKGITGSSGHPPTYSLEKYKREPKGESINIKLENLSPCDTWKKKKKKERERNFSL